MKKQLTTTYNPRHWTRVFHAQWYYHQMLNWSSISYLLLFIGLLGQLMIGFSKGFNLLSLASTLAGMIGFTCVLAITNKRPINGILGFISACLLSYVALKTGNYSDVTMQIAYIITLDMPVLFNKRWQTDFVPRQINWRNFWLDSYFYQILIIFILFWLGTFFLDWWLKSPQLFFDSLSAAIGLTGAILAARGFRDQYFFWTAQGLMSMALWIQTALHGHPVWVLMFTYLLYLANDLLPFFDKHIQWFHYSSKNN